jgi:hypothetical protein
VTLVRVDGNRDSIPGIATVVKIVAVVRVGDVHVVVVVPVVGPVFRPWINEAEPESAVLETWIPANHHYGVTVDAERMTRAEVAIVPVLGNAVALVATALPPVAVLGLPVVCAMLLPSRLLFAFLAMLFLLRLHFDWLHILLLA